MREAPLQCCFVTQPIPAVQELQILPFGHADAFVHGVVDALVGLAHPVGEVVGVLLDQLAAAVGGAAVDDDPLEVAEGLRNNAVDGLPEAVAVV